MTGTHRCNRFQFACTCIGNDKPLPAKYTHVRHRLEHDGRTARGARSLSTFRLRGKAAFHACSQHFTAILCAATDCAIMLKCFSRSCRDEPDAIRTTSPQCAHEETSPSRPISFWTRARINAPGLRLSSCSS